MLKTKDVEPRPAWLCGADPARWPGIPQTAATQGVALRLYGNPRSDTPCVSDAHPERSQLSNGANAY